MVVVVVVFFLLRFIVYAIFRHTFRCIDIVLLYWSYRCSQAAVCRIVVDSFFSAANIFRWQILTKTKLFG